METAVGITVASDDDTLTVCFFSTYSVFLKISLAKLALSSRSFALAFHDAILYP